MDQRGFERDYYQVALVDLDRFRVIDDMWRHAVGDNAVERLAGHIRAELRARDIDYERSGGVELVMALLRVDEREADAVLARLRKSLGSVVGATPDESHGFGSGLSPLPRHAADLPDLTGLGDYALYWTRQRGQDEWRVYSPETSARLAAALEGLAKSIDAKNRFTGGHSERIATFAVKLAESLGFEEHRIADIRQAALLHDVGKIGIKESVLLKTEPPNLEDQDELERHSAIGAGMLAGAGMPELGRWIHHLHERFDGRGYPDGLAGRQIPVESRILHAADALDNMTRPHAYRRHRPLREALAELAFGAGTRLDPELAQRLIKLVQDGEVKIPGHEAVGRPVRQPARRASRSTHR